MIGRDYIILKNPINMWRANNLKKYVKLAVSVLVTVFFLYLSYDKVGKLEFSKIVTYPVNYFLVLLSIICFVLAQLFRAMAWSKAMSKELKTFQVFKAICIGNTTNMILPFRLGEVVRIIVLGNEEKQSYSIVGVNLVLERIIDVIILITLAVFSIFFVDFSGTVLKKILLLRNLMLVGIVFGILFLLLFNRICFNMGKDQNRFTYLQRTVKLFSFFQKIAIIKSSSALAKTIFFLFMSWVWVYICTALGILSIGIHITTVLPAALTVLVMTNLAMLLPSVPGGIGVFQYASIYALEIFGIKSLPAAVLSILLHLIQYAALLPIGIYFFLNGKYSLTKLVERKLGKKPITLWNIAGAANQNKDSDGTGMKKGDKT
jgi:hypothetical protein